MKIRKAGPRQRLNAELQLLPEWDGFTDLLIRSDHVWIAYDTDARRYAGVAGLRFLSPIRAELTMCVVGDEYQGQGLQRRLIEARTRWAVRHGAQRISTYAHAENTASLVNLLKSGYVPFLVTHGEFVQFRYTVKER